MAVCSVLVSLQREQAALWAIEEQREHEEKRQEQEATKMALDRSLKLKLRRKVNGILQIGCAVSKTSSHFHYMVRVDPPVLRM